jgi:hypothetical protein
MNEDKAWVLKCIESSFTDFHFDGCQRLIDLFFEKHGSDNEDAVVELQKALTTKISLAQ